MDKAAMLRMTEYLASAARSHGLRRAGRLFDDAFEAIALGDQPISEPVPQTSEQV